MPPTRIADLVEKILEREQIYEAAFEADVANLTRVHGEAPVREVLQLLDTRRAGGADHWDGPGHTQAVRRGIAPVLSDHEERPDDFHPATEI
jgi:hypothetical protein